MYKVLLVAILHSSWKLYATTEALVRSKGQSCEIFSPRFFLLKVPHGPLIHRIKYIFLLQICGVVRIWSLTTRCTVQWGVKKNCRLRKFSQMILMGIWYWSFFYMIGIWYWNFVTWLLLLEPRESLNVFFTWLTAVSCRGESWRFNSPRHYAGGGFLQKSLTWLPTVFCSGDTWLPAAKYSGKVCLYAAACSCQTWLRCSMQV
jgi:hypothetical protein